MSNVQATILNISEYKELYALNSHQCQTLTNIGNIFIYMHVDFNSF